MQYTVIQCRPKDAQKKLNALAANGWKVASQSESTWTVNQCLGLSNTVDSIINYTLYKDDASIRLTKANKSITTTYLAITIMTTFLTMMTLTPQNKTNVLTVFTKFHRMTNNVLIADIR